MNYKEFEIYIEIYNNKLTEELGGYAEDYIWLNHRSGTNKIDCLDKFIKVFFVDGKYFGPLTIEVDEHLGFINDTECFFVNDGFLDFCIEKGLKGETAYNLYHENLDNNTGLEVGKGETYEVTYKKGTHIK